MQTVTMPYQWFVDRYFSDLERVRDFGLWQVWSARQYQTYLLLVVNEIEEVVVKCQYDSQEEYRADVELVRLIPPDDAAGAGSLASLSPVPPVLPANNARPLPKPGSGAEPPPA